MTPARSRILTGSSSRATFARAGLLGLVLIVPAVSPAQEEDVIEEIVVTGTRLVRDANLVSTLPIQTLNREQIEMSGEFEISELVNDIPALQSSSTSEQSFGSQGNTGPNTNVLSLRALGPNRTLVLVNGRRHVGGQAGSSAVDIGSIPAALVDRVEVLTGGASAVYGADAVTGVVNFVLRDDLDGFSIDLSTGVSDEGDGEQLRLSAAYGLQLADGRGNLTVAIDYLDDKGVTLADRPGEVYASALPLPNPARRFQVGDIDGSATPNFARLFDPFTTGVYNYGLPIPSQEEFEFFYGLFFGESPVLSEQELALFDRSANSPPLAILERATFHITSPYGRIVPGNPYTFQGFDPFTPIDLDANGVPDCLDSFTGYNSSFAPASVGVIGGCWNVGADGSYAPVVNGLIASDAEGFGGDSFDQLRQDPDEILLPNERVSVNVLGAYSMSDAVEVFGELKFARQQVDDQAQETTFWDGLFGAPDNPFLPAFIQPVAATTGGVAISIDPTFTDASLDGHYDTSRLVLGLRGDLNSGWDYEASVNLGRYESDLTFRNKVFVDRWFAAIDAVSDPVTGQPVCRSELDPSQLPPTTPSNFPRFDPGFFTFTPGEGQCVPLNIWAGRGGVSAEALDWVTADTPETFTLEQWVVSGFLRGDSERWFELAGGPLQLLAGGEYRKERARVKLDPLTEGFLPAASLLPSGTNIADVSANGSSLFRPSVTRRSESGSYDVVDVFFETSAPLLADTPGARELTIDAAVRLSDYSTIGRTTTWKANLFYEPVYGLAVRGGFSRAVRAPNISELFSPDATTDFFVQDPCDAALIQAGLASDPQRGALTEANCVLALQSLGLDPFDPTTGDYAFSDPIQGVKLGVLRGNADLKEEEADTITAGVVIQPTFLPGFSATIDYWRIEIDEAISQVSGDAILSGCFQGATLNPLFCDLLERNDDAASPFFGGISFIESTNINLSRFEASGIDFELRYAFGIGRYDLALGVSGTQLRDAVFTEDPTGQSPASNALGSFQRPEWAGNAFLNWQLDDVMFEWQTRFTGKQLLPFARPDTADTQFGDAARVPSTSVHDLTASWQPSEAWRFYGGVRNLTEERPYISEVAYPASARGRFWFAGLQWRGP